MDPEDRSGSDPRAPTEADESPPDDVSDGETGSGSGIENGNADPTDSTDRAGSTDRAEPVVADQDDGSKEGDDEPAVDGDRGSDSDSDDRGPETESKEGVDADEDPIDASDDDETTEVNRASTPTTDIDAGPERMGPSDPQDDRGVLYRFRHDMDGPLMWIREMLSSVAVVLLIGLLLFGLSGVWPPMVAVESGSMEPNMDVGDLVFVTEPGRFAPDAADNDAGVVTHEVGQEAGYRSFDDYGSVVIFQPPGRQASPIIHRAMFHVEEGENWYERADPEYHSANSCEELRHCPAPQDGYITLGDNNSEYDQANGLAEPVAEEWITSVARLRVPYLGYVRLITTGQVDVGDLLTATPVELASSIERSSSGSLLVDHAPIPVRA